MNLETKIDSRLWTAIQNSAEARNYKSAILDSIHLLTDVIRERSGLDGDGVSLVGAAFGGSSPKLKVNHMRTESEQNEQKGIEAMLRGLYQAIRNPRSHDQRIDEERDAHAIVLLVDYLLRVVDRSRSPFSLPTMVARILDSDFVPTVRYSKLLVNEIPRGKRLAACREVFARRAETVATRIRPFYHVILGDLPADELMAFADMISDELRQTSDFNTITFSLKAFPEDMWLRLDEIARLRIEHKLITSVREGRFSAGRCSEGALGTWITNIAKVMILKPELLQAVVLKLLSSDVQQQDYVFQYLSIFPVDCFDEPSSSLVRCVNAGLEAGDTRFQSMAKTWGFWHTAEGHPESKWVTEFSDALSRFVESTPADDPTGDEMPF